MKTHRVFAAAAGLVALVLQPAVAQTATFPGTCSRAFIAASHPAGARLKCARHLVTTRAPGAIDAVILLLSNPDARIRAGAARALWGVDAPKAGLALLRVALSDSVPYVRQAAFENLPWPMTYDILRNGDRATYAHGIAKGLRSHDPHDVAGALAALAFLDKQQAEPVLRRYALDPRPAVRLASIHAFENLMYHSAGIKAFLKSRLLDPSPAVREAVSEQLADYSSR